MYNEATVTEAEYDIQVDDLIHKGDVKWEKLVPIHVAQQASAPFSASLDDKFSKKKDTLSLHI
eukprot:scaffold285909_cov41-Prasinocladus_malaysianus.AAC.1